MSLCGYLGNGLWARKFCVHMIHCYLCGSSSGLQNIPSISGKSNNNFIETTHLFLEHDNYNNSTE